MSSSSALIISIIKNENIVANRKKASEIKQTRVAIAKYENLFLYYNELQYKIKFHISALTNTNN